ncbi:MAG: peptidase T [Planctomycetes bacterium]|nr:peptidase T [Planctomycetota bacterium]
MDGRRVPPLPFSTGAPEVNHRRLLDRFLRYVRIATTANEGVSHYPSSLGQWELGRLLADELRAIGVSDVEHTEHGLLYATIPPNVERSAPTIAFNAHLDTSPESPGDNVRPRVIEAYAGGDIPLSPESGRAIEAASNPELAGLVGRTLITTDGATLLGADDKAGIAVIMELAAHLLEHPEIERGPVRILFTCDEEIGRGTRHVDLERLGATAAYTFDGSGADEVDVETFSGDLAIVTLRGVNIHPSIAKDRMVNAVRGAGEFLARMPRDRLAPESTAGRKGFLHPYQISGGVGETTVRILLRDFETPSLASHADLLRGVARDVERAFPGLTVEVSVREQYRNLRDGLAKEPRAVAFALEAHRRLGRAARQTIVRGGTDGSMLTEKGLPTPNLSVGQHNQHSPLEWACLDEMVQALEVAVQIVRLWSAA